MKGIDTFELIYHSQFLFHRHDCQFECMNQEIEDESPFVYHTMRKFSLSYTIKSWSGECEVNLLQCRNLLAVRQMQKEENTCFNTLSSASRSDKCSERVREEKEHDNDHLELVADLLTARFLLYVAYLLTLVINSGSSMTQFCVLTTSQQHRARRISI